MMTCKKFRERAYLLPDELEREEFEELERHRAECSACASEYARIEHARQRVRIVGDCQPVLTDPLLLVNSVIGRIERDAAANARPVPLSAFDRLIVRLSSPAVRAALACALLLVTGSFALEYTSAFVRMKNLERSVENVSLVREHSQTAAIGQSRLIEAAAELSKLISGKQAVAEVSENWIVMNRQSFRQFLLLYNELKDNASQLPPEFREANPELMKLLEADRQSAQMEVLVTEREALVRELNRLVSSERQTP